MLSAQTNLVQNGSFQNWNGNTPQSWTVQNNVSKSDTGYDDNSSAKLTIDGNSTKPKITANVNLKKDVYYTVAFRYKYLDSNYNTKHPISAEMTMTGSPTYRNDNYYAENNNWTEESYILKPSVAGVYDLNISARSFDGQTFSVLIDNVRVIEPSSLGTADVQSLKKLSVYPTETAGVYKLAGEFTKVKSVSVYDASGKAIVLKPQGDRISIQSLPAGVYTITLKTTEGTVSKRVVKK